MRCSSFTRATPFCFGVEVRIPASPFVLCIIRYVKFVMAHLAFFLANKR